MGIACVLSPTCYGLLGDLQYTCMSSFAYTCVCASWSLSDLLLSNINMYCYIIVLIIELVGHIIKLYLINLQTEVYQLQHNVFCISLLQA